jgi:hypothetical protein
LADYPALYSDAMGCVETTIFNDGELLRLSLRGVEFIGRDFDSLEPVGATPEQLLQFRLHRGDLCSCQLRCQIPVPVQQENKLSDGMLFVEIVLGEPVSTVGIDRLELRLVLTYDGNKFVSVGTSGWFEDELLSIQSQLPEKVFIKACINCLYSDYSPYGHGLFGGMMCFRNLKTEYLKIKSKREFLPLHGRQDRFVQETYLCEEFERRTPGTGYRG